MNEHAFVPPGRPERILVVSYLAVFGAVLLLMMLLGLLMRLEQGGAGLLRADLFYQILTAHGAVMVGTVAIGSAAVMWHFLRQHVVLSSGIFGLNLALCLVGALLILGAVFLGEFASAWTFLHPLPAKGQLWSQGAAASFLVGLALIGVGFLLMYMDIASALIRRYGGLGRSLGVPALFGGDQEPPPLPVVASTMILIVNTLAIIAGATIIVMMLVNLFNPAFEVNPLLAKNLIYFFGHTFVNATIYMAVIGVYQILPKYTGRPWKVNRIVLAGWLVSTLAVLTAFFHHLYMDFAQPTTVQVIGQVMSYCSGFPVLLVTAHGTLTNIYRSGIRWNLPAGLLVLGIFGWAAGVIPAIIDATIPVNEVMHNTQWVPGHFHFYLLLGVVAMVLGFMTHLAREAGAVERLWDRFGFWAFLGGGLLLVWVFLYSGSYSVPRRYAVYLPEWTAGAQVGAVAAGVVILATLLIVTRFLLNVRRVSRAT